MVHRFLPLLSSALVLIQSSAQVSAQDMPLSQILSEGEDWKPAPESATKLLAISSNHSGGYSLDRAQKRIQFKDGNEAREVKTPVKEPACLLVLKDGGTLVVGDASAKQMWAFRIEKDGSLTCGERYYPLRTPTDQIRSEVSALALDSAGRVYAATPLGIQIFDPTGRLCGVINSPARELAELVFGAAGEHELYAKAGEEIFVRKLKATGPTSK